MHRPEVPRAAPDPGFDGRPVYRFPVEKHRLGTSHYLESRDVADEGAGSPGRLFTQALEAARFARAVVRVVNQLSLQNLRLSEQLAVPDSVVRVPPVHPPRPQPG